MSNPTNPFSWQMPTPTDLVTDLPADFEVFGQAVATSLADLLGGTTGQVLSKTTNADMDFTWVAANPGDITGVTAGTGISGGGTSGTVTVTNDMATTITASGDIIIGTGSGTYDNLPIGTTNQVLTADTTVSPYKVKWAAPAAGGAYTLINTGGTTLTGASVTIGSIPGTYKDLYLVVSNYLPSSAALLQMRYNGSSTANTYYHIQGTVFGSVLANTAFNQDQCRLGAMEQNTTTSNSLFVHTIFDYANTNIWKHSWGSFVTNGVANSAQFNWAPMANIWSNTSAITSIELFPNTGTFTSGTAYLYGVK